MVFVDALHLQKVLDKAEFDACAKACTHEDVAKFLANLPPVGPVSE